MTSVVKNADYSEATNEVNTPKNRYQDKIPCMLTTHQLKLASFQCFSIADNHSRVRLKPAAMQGSDYINASFVDVSKSTMVPLPDPKG